MGLSNFNYDEYAKAIKGLAELPDEMHLRQEKHQNDLLAKKKQVESAIKLQLDDLEKTESIAYQQFDEVACQFKLLFSIPASRPALVPSPLSIKDAMAAQNLLAFQLKGTFDSTKESAVEKKKTQMEAVKAEQKRLAALKAKEDENRRKQEEDEQEQREEAYRKELEKSNRSLFKKLIDFLTE